MKYLLSVLMLITLLSSTSFAEDNISKQTALERYIAINIELFLRKENINESEMEKRLKEIESFKENLSEEELWVANETILFRLNKQREETRIPIASPELKEYITTQKEVLQRRMQEDISNAKDKKEKEMIEQDYLERIRLLERRL